MQDEADMLVAGAFPEAAAALRARKSAIIDHWVEAVAQQLPNAEKLTFQQLQNSLPELLDQLIAALERTDRRPVNELIAASPVHGETRFHQDFNLDELLIEYHLLRRVLIHQVADAMPRPLHAGEIAALDLGVDTAARRAAVAFAHHQMEKVQAGAEAQAKYLSFLSHDLRGGLNSVLLMLEVLQRELESEPRLAGSLQDLSVMKRSILDTVGTMDRFLQAEKLRKGAFSSNPSEFDLHGFAEDLVHQFTPQASQKGLLIRQHVPAGCIVRSDRELLSLILQNLLSNAVKYSARGTIEVRCEACPTEAEGEFILSVVDQGPGLDPQTLAGLFDPYTRGQTHGQEGSGLGLSIARQAADLLGAQLWAESELGAGAVFHLRIPASP